MEEILDQLRLVLYPIIYKVLAPSQVVVWDFWTINTQEVKPTIKIIVPWNLEVLMK